MIEIVYDDAMCPHLNRGVQSGGSLTKRLAVDTRRGNIKENHIGFDRQRDCDAAVLQSCGDAARE